MGQVLSFYYHTNHTIPFLERSVLLKHKGVWMMRMSFLKLQVYVGGGNKNDFDASVVMKSLFHTW